VNYVDPSGHWVISVGIKLEAAVIIGGYILVGVNFDKTSWSITKTTGGTVMTNASMSASIFSSYYRQKSNVSDLRGFGLSMGISYTWGLYVGLGIGAEIMSNGKIGVSGNGGVGFGIAPAHWSVSVGWTTQVAKGKYSSVSAKEKSYNKKGVKYSVKRKDNITTIRLKDKRVQATIDKNKKVRVTKY
jgi:hypothetical protein